MVFTRKNMFFMGYVSFREGNWVFVQPHKWVDTV